MKYFPCEVLRGVLQDRHHLPLLKDMCSFWLVEKQDSVVERTEAEQGECDDNDQGADVEFQVPGERDDLRLVCDPRMHLSQEKISQSVEQKGGDKVDPSPFPVHHETISYFKDSIFLSVKTNFLPIGERPKVMNPKIGRMRIGGNLRTRDSLVFQWPDKLCIETIITAAKDLT